eukprot:gene12070-14261_t
MCLLLLRGAALLDRKAKRQLLSALDREYYKNVRNPSVKDIEIDKVDLEDTSHRRHG